MRGWLGWLSALLLFSLSSGLGRYALAPGGAYRDYAMEGVSHDWHRYLWALSVPGEWRVLVLHGLFVGTSQRNHNDTCRCHPGLLTVCDASIP